MSRPTGWMPACLALALFPAGCNPAPVSLGPSPPHGGQLTRLGEGEGYIELVREEVAGKPDEARLLAYFLDKELKPMASPPTAASFQPKGRGAKAVGLKAAGESDPAKAGGLASDPFPAPGGVDGTLTATVGTTPAAVRVNLR